MTVLNAEEGCHRSMAPCGTKYGSLSASTYNPIVGSNFMEKKKE